VIQQAFGAYVRNTSCLDQVEAIATSSLEALEMEMQMIMLTWNMTHAMLYLRDGDDFVYSISGSLWVTHWDDE
jgi:hypothetical protein